MIITENQIVSFYIDIITSKDKNVIQNAFEGIEDHWQSGHEIMLIETLYFSRNAGLSKNLVALLEQKTGKHFGYDFNKWYQWLWNKDANYPEIYFNFKARLHVLIDPRFKTYFENRAKQSTIRLDEVRWGGVRQDGIPPLRGPEMITAANANYLNDNDIVFGIEVNGDARAYPKRILAWHEMFVDTVGGINFAGVYCTLCGTVILYETSVDGVDYNIGTSGFLYRSNKLMYDKATQSLWSTLEGEPVIGPLVGKGIKLPYRSVVTTSWGEWKSRHPETQVLSLNTGYERDYGEGVAYRDYFSTDKLMFNVPNIDTRLNNKDEVLVLRHLDFPAENIAIASPFLKKNPVYTTKIGTLDVVVLTDTSGAHRAFITNGVVFEKQLNNFELVDTTGAIWVIDESELKQVGTTKTLERLHTFNAFWFGYQAAFPDVTLVK